MTLIYTKFCWHELLRRRLNGFNVMHLLSRIYIRIHERLWIVQIFYFSYTKLQKTFQNYSWFPSHISVQPMKYWLQVFYRKTKKKYLQNIHQILIPFSDAATLVDVNIFVRSFSAIDDVKMVRQFWFKNDYRLYS